PVQSKFRALPLQLARADLVVRTEPEPWLDEVARHVRVEFQVRRAERVRPLRDSRVRPKWVTRKRAVRESRRFRVIRCGTRLQGDEADVDAPEEVRQR